MVSFQCDGCCDTVKKPALDKHRNRCWNTFTCLDCSTTFQGTEYKSHTSCVSEAEKYQGALYKGPKKNGQPAAPVQAAAPTTQITTPVDAPAVPAVPAAASAAAIHPDRAHLASAPPPSQHQNPYQARRGGNAFPSLHGNGRFGNQNQGPREARPPKYSATGANGAGGAQAPMRTWGSAAASPVPETSQAANGNVAVEAPAPTNPVFESKASKNKKKKDKKGTGSRANTRNPPGSTAEPEAAPAVNPAKKRKAEGSPEPSTESSTPVEMTEDVRKRLRKNVAKINRAAGELSLEEWIEKVQGKKDKVGGKEGVMKGVKVVWQGEGWALSV